LLTGELARAEPKRLRYRLLHVAARLAVMPASHATHPCRLALGRRARRRVHTRPRAFRAHLTTRRHPRRPASPRRPGATRRCPPTTPRPRSPATAATGASTTLTHTQLANPYARTSRRACRHDSHQAASCTIRATRHLPQPRRRADAAPRRLPRRTPPAGPAGPAARKSMGALQLNRHVPARRLKAPPSWKNPAIPPRRQNCGSAQGFWVMYDLARWTYAIEPPIHREGLYHAPTEAHA
jgi:hypothetical protein